MANIEFEHIDPWVDGQGDTGYSSRLKLRRNFEKIKAWMDSVAQQLSGKYLSKENDDEAAGKISFRAGSEWGPATGLWGWVKESYTRTVGAVTQTLKDGVAWFHWLLADRLEVAGIASFKSGVNVDGDLHVSSDIHADGDVSAGGELSGRTGFFGDVTVLGTTQTKNLVVTGIAHFFELMIDKLRSAGGAQLYTPADGFTVEAVTRLEHDGGWRRRLWWRATDGTRKTKNMWLQGDQAICMNFNSAAAGSYGQVSNKQFWGLVAYANTATGTTPTWDSTNPEWEAGKPNPYEVTDWHYIDLYCGEAADSPIEVDGDGKPLWQGDIFNVATYDDIAMLGSRRDEPARQSALYLSAYASFDDGLDANGQRVSRALVAPLIASYEGINDFNLASHRRTFKDTLGGTWVGDLKVVVDGAVVDLDDYVNSIVDVTADFYRLRVLKENAWVTADDQMNADLRYQLEHVHHGTVTTEAWTGSGYTIRVKANGSGSTLATVTYETGTSGMAIFSHSYATGASKPDYFSVELIYNNTTVIDRRVVRVGMKSGTVFAVTEQGVTSAVQQATQYADGRETVLRGLITQTATTLRSEYTEAVRGAVSRNLLLNTDFSQLVDGDFRLFHTVATMQWQGYRQWSHVRSGQWEKVLRHNQQHTVSFYARGTGRCGVIIHIYKVQADGTAVFTNTQYSKDFSLSAELTRFSFTFKPYPSTSSMRDTGGYAFCLMLGTVDTTSGEHWISHPQLELGASATTYTTGAANLLVNPELLTVRNGIPASWDAWDNNDLYAPSTREVVTWMRPQFWARWENAGELPRQLDILQDGELRYMRLKPKTYFEGLMQTCSDKYGVQRKELEHGKQYTVSFYARGTGWADVLIHLYRLDASGEPVSTVAQPFGRLSLSDSWVRHSVTFVAEPDEQHPSDADLDGYGWRVMIGCSHYADDDTPSTEVIEMARVQLEEGTPATAWGLGEANPSVVRSILEQTARQLKLAVYKDEAQRAGIDIEYDEETDEGSVTLQGDKVVIDGDLDLKGLTTENVARVDRSGMVPTLVNMGIGVSNAADVVKSVQVKGNMTDADAYSPHLVVLPFYDSDNTKWSAYQGSGGGDGIVLNADGTFNLSAGRKVVRWTQNGTRLTVTNEVIMKYRNWQGITTASQANTLGGLVLVCADGRIVCDDNLASPSGGKRFNPSTMNAQLASQPELHAGCFSCGGYMARFIVLLPGQSLQLRSQIITPTDGSGHEVLVWVVENPSEFAAFYIQNQTSQIKLEASEPLYYLSNTASYNPSDGMQGSQETIMAPAVMNKRGSGYKTVTYGNY